MTTLETNKLKAMALLLTRLSIAIERNNPKTIDLLTTALAVAISDMLGGLDDLDFSDGVREAALEMLDNITKKEKL